jgi:small subunit ribosomal protein S16
MVKLRSQRFGSKKSPFYRIVATDSRNPRDGRYIEVVGTYNPLTKPATVSFDEEKVLYWLNNGAQPTDTVKSFLKEQGVYAKWLESKSAK